MKHLKALVLMQLKDKIDLGFLRTKKALIRKIIFTVLKFAIVLAATYLIRFILQFMVDGSDTPQIMMTVLTFLIGISFLTCTVGLVKSLYFADDNRVLITMPVEGSWIFVSKMIVYYLYELAREYMLIVPIVLGLGIYNFASFGFWFIPWTMLIMVIVPAVPVLVGALLSIPSLYIARFANRFQVAKIVLFLLAVGAFVAAVVWAIGLIPEDIDLLNKDGEALKNGIKTIVYKFEDVALPIAWLVYLFIGKEVNTKYTLLVPRTFIILAGLIAAIAVLFALVYFISRPLFFKMMSKSFEFEKKAISKEKLNTPRGKWYAFTLKEFKLCVMNIEVSMSFLAVYVIVPLLIYLMNSLYAAMDISFKGNVMAWAFNFLIMLLPMLASNSVIATLFSKEGRAGYMKKTEPVNILMPLVAKLFFFLVLSIPSIIATTTIFGSFYGAEFEWYDLIMLAFMLLFFQYGHIFLSALFDIMNPQNEQYATVGDSVQNPNENKSTLVAFLISGAVALFSFIILDDYTFNFWMSSMVTSAMLRLFVIAAVFCAVCVSLFVKNVKAYYYEK